ncbi:MAG: hypothetical protein GX808_01080 [Syntrophomonadaceae bacterium]|jgi:hypothetical protein|nr:hypothetical protein [Syntrophomonadaceae bacterium]
MRIGFMILIAIVFIVTIVFGIIIWKQSVKFEKKALVLKQRKEAYIKELELQQARIEALGGDKGTREAEFEKNKE